jgi:hypothetical protein
MLEMRSKKFRDPTRLLSTALNMIMPMRRNLIRVSTNLSKVTKLRKDKHTLKNLKESVVVEVQGMIISTKINHSLSSNINHQNMNMEHIMLRIIMANNMDRKPTQKAGNSSQKVARTSRHTMMTTTIKSITSR